MLNEQRILILAIGNRSRGDDGVAPKLLDRVASKINAMPGIEFVTEEVYQLQPEHIYDIESADALLIIDAAENLGANIDLCPINTNENAAIGTHTVSPDNLLGLYQRLLKKSPPPCLLLTIKASEFGFTEKLSDACQNALEEAESFLLDRLTTPSALFDPVVGSHTIGGRI